MPSSLLFYRFFFLLGLPFLILFLNLVLLWFFQFSSPYFFPNYLITKKKKKSIPIKISGSPSYTVSNLNLALRLTVGK